MNKRELRKARMEMYDAEAVKWGMIKKIGARMVIRVQAEYIKSRAVLILNCYRRQDIINPQNDLVMPVYRIFLSKNEWEFATQDLTERNKNWTGMTMADLAYKEYDNKLPAFELDRDIDLKLIKYYFAFSHDPCWENYIKGFQKEVKQRRRLKKNESWITEVREKMAEVPRELPEDFGKWIQRDVLYKSRYIYYKYDKAKKGIGQQGYCTHCHNDVVVDGAKHRKMGVCPICGSKIMYLCESKAGYILDRTGAAVFQSCSSGLLLRCFSVEKRYYPDYRKPTLKVFERERIFLGDKIKRYTYGCRTETDDTRWQETGYWHNGEGVLYVANLRKLLEGTKWQYSGLYEYASEERGKKIHAVEYLEKYEKNPQLEHVVKMGLTHLVDSCVERYYNPLDFSKSNIFQILGLSKEDTRYMQKINGGANVLEALKKLRQKKIKITYEQFEEAWSLFSDCFDDFNKVLDYGTAGRILKYLKQQVYGRKREKYKNILKDWIDYISMGKELGYDFKNDFVLFPNNLKERHDAAAFLIAERRKKKQIAEKRKESRRISKASKKLEEKFAFETKKLMIAIPKNSEDIVREGQIMHHCVGSYIKKVANGETAILFIRKKEAPEEPFYTMEVSGNRVVQCRGKYNGEMTEEVRRFVEQFKRKCLKPESKEKKTA